MDYQRLHPWEVTYKEAKDIQRGLRNRIVLSCNFSEIDLVAGADCSYSKRDHLMYGVICVLTYPELELIEKVKVRDEVKFPYIPGLLTFREGPCLLKACERLKNEPSLIIFDGQGIAHPCGLGIATHLGIVLDKPTIGCAKSPLLGQYKEPVNKKGAYSYLYEKGKVVGIVLRTRKNVKPVFVSPGFKIDFKKSIEIVLACCKGYRLPEPLRLAHLVSKRDSNYLAHEIHERHEKDNR
ncbi:MAG: deoxyribonuclease V [bacterium]|nr:deoxyribonuclease V [bacterium]